MLDVLEVYERPYDAKKPVVCIDEKSKQLLGRERISRPVRPGKERRRDYEYVRHGTVNLFVAVEPKGKRRCLRVTRRRTAQDFARYLEYVVMKKYRDAEKVILVLDNLNIHFETSISGALPQERAEKLLKRIEPHYTPKHASWLDMAEIEISALRVRFLNEAIRRLASIAQLSGSSFANLTVHRELPHRSRSSTSSTYLLVS